MKQQHMAIRALCFFAAALSGVVLLAKVYGMAEMSVTVPWIVLPASLGLAGLWGMASRWRLEEVGVALGIGIFGGLLSTFAYDLTRLPFHLSGFLVFSTNSTYGMWITDAAAHSRGTEMVGWLYHFSNGIAFAVMYAVFMRGRHWLWAIVYAFALESIAVFSHFGQVFSLAGNYGMISIAYLAHISYGLPIGIMVYRWPVVARWMAINKFAVGAIFAVFFAVFLVPLLTPAKVARDRSVESGAFLVRGTELVPYMRRIQRGASVTLVNRGTEDATIRVVKTGDRHEVPAGGTTEIAFPAGGIFQILVETDGPTHSSFVLSEPVSESGR